MQGIESKRAVVGSRGDAPPILVGRELVTAGMLTSGLIHLMLTPEHLRDALLLGLGFLVVAILQCVLGVILFRRPAPQLWQASVVLLVFSLTVYVISRTFGLPFGHDHRSEAIGVMDMVAKGAELVALGGLLVTIHATTRDWPRGRSLRMAPLSRYAYLLALMLVGVVAALILAHSHGASNERRSSSGSREPEALARVVYPVPLL